MSERSKQWIPWLLALIVLSLGLNVYLITQQGGDGAAPAGSGEQMYVCPMHPQVTDTKASDCPICGMKLVPVVEMEDASTEPHSSAEYDHSAMTGKTMYECPMKCEPPKNEPGRCSVCGMKLKPITVAGTPGERKIAFYRSPMDPKITSPTPRTDKVGMDFIPVYEDELTDGAMSVDNRVAVTIDPARQQLIGLRTEPVTRGNISGAWQTVGRVQADPTRVSKISVKVEGYVEKVHVDFVNRPVRKGEPLFTFYSPELFSAQQEYLLALDSRDRAPAGKGDDDFLLRTVRQKLKLWDITDDQIKRLEETREPMKALTFVSPATGVVTAKEVVEGSALMPGETAYEVTDLSRVWVMADAYQSDAERARTGMRADVAVAAFPDREFSGTVTFVDPVLDPATLTFKVRLEVENPSGDLKPGMFSELHFRSESHEALMIPMDAVIPSGRGSYVFVAMPKGRFEPRSVILGDRSGEQVEVRYGLSEGETVVTHANYLVDSESSLRAALKAARGS